MKREPITQNYATESGAAPSEPRDFADRASNITKTTNTDNSVNKHLPYIWFNGVIAALALGLAIGAVIIADIKTDTVQNKVDAIKDRATVSENHWRTIETEVGIIRSDVNKLQEHKP